MERPGVTRRAGIIAFAPLFALLLVPALVNGGAFLFPDTTAYVRGADAVAWRLTGHRTVWSDRLFARLPQSSPPASVLNDGATPASSENRGEQHVTLAGRSVYYGMLVYLSFLIGGLCPMVVAQAGLTTAAILLTIDAFSPSESSPLNRRYAAALILPFVTGAGFFAAFAMPDFLAPLAILAIANLALPNPAGGRRTLFWFALLALAVLAHSTTLLMAAALIALLFLAKLLPGRVVARPRLLLPVCAIAIGILGEMAFSMGVHETTGYAAVRPPFLTARLLDDGVGRRYLQRHCGDRPAFAICRYRDRRPVQADTFLWNLDPSQGVFMTLPPSEQRAMSDEQTRFAAAVFLDDPLGVANAFAHNALRQFTLVGLGEFNVPPYQAANLHAATPPSVWATFSQTRALRDVMPTGPIAVLSLPIELIGTMALAIFAWLGRGSSEFATRTAAMFAAVIVIAIFVNAVLCGALSGPHDRYQARMLFLIPLAVIIAATHLTTLRQQHRRDAHGAG